VAARKLIILVWPTRATRIEPAQLQLGAAAVGFAIGGSVGAVVPEILREITNRRVGSVAVVAEHACDLAGFDGPALVAWVKASDRHAGFLAEAFEAAWQAAARGATWRLTTVLVRS
jgi:hypothetical protein